MKRHMADYIEQNRRAYSYYLHAPGRLWHVTLSIIMLLGIFIMIFLSRRSFLTQYFLFEAGTQDLGHQEVQEWVGIQVRSHCFDGIFWALLGVTIFTLVWIGVIYTKVKSYHLYKMQKRLILPPVILYIVLAVVMIVSNEKSWYRTWFMIQIFMEISPILLAFKIFLPLDMRESYERALSVFDAVSNIVIKKL